MAKRNKRVVYGVSEEIWREAKAQVTRQGKKWEIGWKKPLDKK